MLVSNIVSHTDQPFFPGLLLTSTSRTKVSPAL